MAEPYDYDEMLGLGAFAEDPIDEAIQTPGEIIEEAKQPTYGDRARAVSRMSRKKALERLQKGYTALSDQKFNQQQKWLAFAQGMLAPTRTGGFGESLGMAVEQLQEPLKEEREFEMDRATRLAAMEQQMAGAEEAFAEREIDILGEEERARRVTGRRRAWQPRLYFDETDGQIYEAVQGQGPEGELVTQWTTGEPPEGAQLTPVTSEDPTQLIRLAQARKGGGIEAEQIQLSTENARKAREELADAYYGLTLLEDLKNAGSTGGFQAKLNEIRRWLGSDAQDVTDRGVLMNIFGRQLIDNLGAFGYNPSQKDLQVAEQLSANITAPGATNEALLQGWVRKLEKGLLADMAIVNQYGNERQKLLIAGPLLNKGIAPELLEYAGSKGFEFEEFNPFPTKEPPPVIPRQVGDVGLLETPHTFPSRAEFNRIMADPEEQQRLDMRPGDFILIPGEENPRKWMGN